LTKFIDEEIADEEMAMMAIEDSLMNDKKAQYTVWPDSMKLLLKLFNKKIQFSPDQCSQ